jgi:hypothetical protein
MNPIEIKIGDSSFAGGYSFSASSNVIKLTKEAEDMSQEEYDRLVKEATRVRELYVQYNEENKAKGIKESPSTMKARAVSVAKSELVGKSGVPRPPIKEVKAGKPISTQVEEILNDPLFDVIKQDDSINVTGLQLDNPLETDVEVTVENLESSWNPFDQPVTDVEIDDWDKFDIKVD